MSQNQRQHASGNIHKGKDRQKGDSKYDLRNHHRYVQKAVQKIFSLKLIPVHAYRSQGPDDRRQQSADKGNHHGIPERFQQRGIIKQFHIPVQRKALPAQIRL